MLFLLTAAKQTKRIREKYFHCHPPPADVMVWHASDRRAEHKTYWVRSRFQARFCHLISSLVTSQVFKCQIYGSPFFPQCSDINTINDGLGTKSVCLSSSSAHLLLVSSLVSSMAGSWRWSFLLSVLCWQDQQLFGLKYVWCLIIYFYFLDQMVWWIT